MATAAGVRIGWRDLPVQVRDAVEEILGARVVEAVSQVGGFSPGTADRVRLADGRRAFVKAVGVAQNEHSPGFHRQEARVTATLPDWAPTPKLLGCHDDGDWVALVFEDIDGRQPVIPWRPDELARVLSTLDAFARKATPAPIDGLAAVAVSEEFAGWHQIAADPPNDLDPWAAARLDQLRAEADRGLAAITGDTLVHMDVRADNLLISPDGEVTLVDWPWAVRGPAWLDSVMLLINVALYGGHDIGMLLTDRATAHNADRDDLRAVLIGFAGFFLDEGRKPPPPGLPTVRAFQRAQGNAVVGWLAEDLTGR